MSKELKHALQQRKAEQQERIDHLEDASFWAAAFAEAEPVVCKPRRIRIPWFLITVLFVLIAAAAVWIMPQLQESRIRFTVTQYEVNTDQATHSVRVAFLSDLHLREYGEDNAQLIEAVRAAAPDLIISGGDMTRAGQSDDSSALALFRELTRLAPVVGVLGNHELYAIATKNDTGLPARFEETGARILRNEAVRFTLNGTEVEVVGLTVTSPENFAYGSAACMDALDPSFNGLRIVISHVPAVFKSDLSSYRFQLGLSGHVHGGGIRIPGLGSLVSAEEGFFPEYAEGQHVLANGACLIIGRGLGDSTIPLRINNLPELVIVDLTAGQ